MATVTVVGSSDAFNAAGRAHSCYLVEGEGAGPIMVDFGATALAALRRVGREPTELAGIAVTHLHGDHIGGFPFLVIDGMFNAIRHDRLEVVGPVNLEERITRLCDVTYGDVAEREKPYELSFRSIEPGERATLAGIEIAAFAAEHMDPPEQPLCLRLELAGGGSVAFSGDTKLCDGLFEAAAGVDLLVAECSALAPPCGRHITWSEWREVLPAIGAKRVLLSHLGAEVRANIPRLLTEVPPGVDVTFADDGLCLTLDRAVTR
jgi:ribonuclease BN (tRNA processing enzyme)